MAKPFKERDIKEDLSEFAHHSINFTKYFLILIGWVIYFFINTVKAAFKTLEEKSKSKK